MSKNDKSDNEKDNKANFSEEDLEKSSLEPGSFKETMVEMMEALADIQTKGDLMMDAPRHDSWRELTTYAADREWWRARVRAIRQQPLVRVERGSHMVEGADRLPFTVS